MMWSLTRKIILLPGTVLVFVPAILVFLTKDTMFAVELLSPNNIFFWIAIIFGLFGILIAIWTVTLFVKIGKGTPAPWEPPQKLVVRGPYRHVRNPMLTSVFLMLTAESILLQSLPIAAWMAFVIIANLIYMPLIEEKGLEKRFGEEYKIYKKHVPRWIPRLTPWKPN